MENTGKVALSAVLIILVVIAVADATLGLETRALDHESHKYAERVLPAIASHWRAQTLLANASPELSTLAERQDITHLFHLFRRLGPLQHTGQLHGRATLMWKPERGWIITAEYRARMRFQRGPALVRVSLVRRHEQWQIYALSVDSPRLVQTDTTISQN